MKTRTSEYRRCYKVIPAEYRNELHEQMVKYRNERREKEFAHEKIKWDSSDSSGRSTPISSEQEKIVKSPEQDVDNTFEKQSEGENDNTMIIEEDVVNTQECVGEEDKSKAKTDHRKKRVESNLKVDIEDKPPFATYGSADRELETARKRTHNVKANKVYVYPAALKKLKLIKAKQTREKDARAESRASVAAALRIRQKAQNNEVWMTEYQRCYSQASGSRPGTVNSSHNENQQAKKRRPHTTSSCGRRTNR